MSPRNPADMPAPGAGPTPRNKKQKRNKKLTGTAREFGGFVVALERQGRRWKVEVFDGERSLAKLAASPLSRALIAFLREAGLTRKLLSDYKKWAAQLVEAEGKNGEGQALQSAAAAEEAAQPVAETQTSTPRGQVPAEQGGEAPSAEHLRAEDAEAKAEEKQASKDTVATEAARKAGEPSAEEAPEPAAPQQVELPPKISEGAAQGEASPPSGEAPRGQSAEAAEPLDVANTPPPPPSPAVDALVEAPPAEAVPPQQPEPEGSPPGPAEVPCLRTTYERCSALGITEAVITRARQEPPGVRLALLAIWRTVLAGLGADAKSFEPLWVEAGLDPSVTVTPEDRTRAEAAAEEVLAGCRLCVIDMPTFLKLVRRITLAERPDGDAMLVVDVGYNGSEVAVATRLAAWVKEKKDKVEYVIPLVLRERLRHLGLSLDVDPRDLYVELVRRAERYQIAVDAYVRPILLHVVEALRASPHLAKCTKDHRVIYIASEVFRTSSWYFNSKVGLGRNTLYSTFRQHGLLARSETVVVEFVDEYGERVRRRALAFRVDALGAFIEYDVKQLCRASGLMAEEEKVWGTEPQAVPPKEGA